MSVAIVLPARLASTRLPGKLLLARTGKTVLEHTIERAQEAQTCHPDLFTTILVACDDKQLIHAARRTGVHAVLTRANHQSGTDRIAEAAQNLTEDIIVNLQADEPEIEPESILALGRLASAESEPERVPVATLAVPISDYQTWMSPSVVKVVVNFQSLALYFSRSPIPCPREGACADGGAFQIVPPDNPSGPSLRAYGMQHVGVYAYRKDFLNRFTGWGPSCLELLEKLEQLRVLEHGFGIHVGLISRHPPGIDTPEDYEAFVKRWESKSRKSEAQSPKLKAQS